MSLSRKQLDDRKVIKKQLELLRNRVSKDLFNQFLANHVNAIKGSL